MSPAHTLPSTAAPALPFDPEAQEPRALWHYFATLSRLPRGSGNEDAVVAWLEGEAAALGLEVARDRVGNLRMRKGASPGRAHAPVTALQAHVDMVCEKDAGTIHDFTRDPLRLFREGDFLRADGTTLGADNGIGVAAILALLASRDLPHGPLEALFTVDEERGVRGVQDIPEGWLKARYLLNLDGEDATQLTISCAGGLGTILRRRLARRPLEGPGRPFRLRVRGLRGGHSGVDIHLGRGNALRILAQVLGSLPEAGLAGLGGGSAHNALPREAWADLVTGDEDALQAQVARRSAALREQLGLFDPDLRIDLEALPERPATLLEPGEARSLLELLRLLPHGVHAMSPDVPGLVQASSNLAVLRLEGDEAVVVLSHRSPLASAKAEAAWHAAALGERYGFRVEQGGDYPGWKPEPDSPLVGLAREVSAAVLGRPATLRAIHAGLECGILGAKHPGLQMISFGPDILDAHSPRERVSLASVERMWAFLTALVDRLAA